MFFAKIVNEARMSGKYVQKSDSQRNPRKALRRIAGSAPTKSTWMPHSISAPHQPHISPIWPASARISPLLTAPPGRSPGGMARSTAYRRAPPLPEHPGTRTSRRHAGTGRGSHRAPGQRFALAQHRQHAQYSACAQMRRVSSRTAPFSASAARTPMASTPWRRAHCAARGRLSASSSPSNTSAARAPGTAIQTDGRAHAGCRGSLRRLGHTAWAHARNAGRCPAPARAAAARTAPVRPPARRPGRLRSDASWDSGPGRNARLQSEATAASYRPSGRLKRASMVSAAPSMSLRARRCASAGNTRRRRTR